MKMTKITLAAMVAGVATLAAIGGAALLTPPPPAEYNRAVFTAIGGGAAYLSADELEAVRGELVARTDRAAAKSDEHRLAVLTLKAFGREVNSQSKAYSVLGRQDAAEAVALCEVEQMLDLYRKGQAVQAH